MYRSREIIPARNGPADLIIVNAPPPGLGGRAGMLWQALTWCREGSVILFPGLSADEHAVVTAQARRHPSFAGLIDCSAGGLARLAVVCLNPLDPDALELPDLICPFG